MSRAVSLGRFESVPRTFRAPAPDRPAAEPRAAAVERRAPAGPAEPVGEPDGGVAARCLGAVRRLAGATGASVVRHDHHTGQASVVVGAEGEAAVLEQATAGPGAILWTGADKATLLARIDGRAATSRWLTLRFDRPTAASRARAEAALPEYLAILSAALGAADEAERLRAAERAMAAVLDQQDCGVVVLRADHSVMLANATAAATLRDGAFVTTPRGSLRPAAYQEAVRFQTAVDCVVAAAQADAPRRPGGMVMLIRGPDGDEEQAAIAVLTPVRADRGPPGEGDAAAILYLQRPDQSAGRGLEPICQLHGLSPVETRLVGHLVAGLTISDAAAEMRIKRDTARAYLKQVFAKTGTHRQSSLLRIITRYQRAIRGDFDFRIA